MLVFYQNIKGDMADKQICFRINMELHEKIKVVCAMRHCTMKSWIMKAIAEKLLKDEAGLVKPGSKG